MIVERSTHPQFVSNTFLVADGEGGPGVLRRRRRAGGAADRGGRAARARRRRTCCSPTTTSTTSARSAQLRERWPELEVLISPRERELLGGRRRDGEGAASVRARSRPARRCASAGSRCARCTRPGTPPGCSRSSSATASSGAAPPDGALASAAGRLHRREASCSPATRCSRTRSAACRRPGHSTYADLRDSIMGTLMELPPETVIYPGPRRRHDGRARVGVATPSSASGAGSTRRAPSPARRSASPPRWCCSAPTTTAAPRPGCAGRTAPTTSCPARKSSARPEPPLRRSADGRPLGP